MENEINDLKLTRETFVIHFVSEQLKFTEIIRKVIDLDD
ncbi:MAG: hypothetical protein HeimC3_35900 [Candidatus Heimdallarchaeota archaeon LC_3]|nr:MAG: hypothetical protein HeimC3_35900 [Candidatus Heimdallarchaeota archaeon LC_3]